jgi:tape measure domain-containing protein
MAGQNADMTLKVGLDLNFFRQELQKASSSLAGQPIDINVRFNKKGIADQYRLLTRYLGGKKSFDVKIESNTLNALTDKVANFQKTLKALKDEKIELSIDASANIEKFSKEKIRKIRAQIRRDIVSGGGGEIQLPTKLATPNIAAFVKALAKQAQVTVAIKNGATGKEARNVLDAIEDRIQSDQKIKQGGGKLRVPTSIKASINNADVSDFKKAVNEKLGSIAIKIKAEVDIAKTPAQIQAEVARKMQDIARMGAERMSGGGVTESARREQFRTAITGEGIGSLKNIAKQVGVGGYSKYKSDTATELINKLVQEASIEAITKYLDPQAVMRNPDRSGLNKVLDTFARGLFQMLGMDPATIRREMQQRRALPGVNFPSTIPPRNIPIGPSGTGRALPPGAIASALPGTAFGAQKYLPTGLSNEMQSIMRSAAYAFVDSIKQQIRSVRIGLAASQQPLLGPSRIAGLLPAGVGRAPSVYSAGAVGGETRAEMMARREREARMRSDLRGMDVIGGGAGRTPSPYSYAYRGARPASAIVPYAAGGAIVPQPAIAGGAGGGIQPPSGGGGFGGFGGMGGFGRAMGGINLPGAGTIRELGDEFGFATKQVLLFGQAYKLLGFLQSLPGQVGAAVGQLQSFRNTLNAVTPSAEEARASNELLLGLMEKYNVPLQSARDGFTKLYASMAPAGFSGDEIRDLFTGITKAAATFGMSADKVDRVNYAFAQMASKGQVMSEELKGQLGDVLPGAMALFAKAAGFKGPKAIQDFSAALEDGAYKGEAMVALLKNVTVVMNKGFGPGAEGAALTFQGVMNRMQNSMTLFYEAFEPVAVGFLNSVVVPMTNGIKQLTDGLNAFFTGTAAKTAGGFAIAQELERLRPAFDGIGQNVQKLLPIFQQFAATALNIGKIFLEIAGNPFVGYLLRIYAAVLPLTLAIQALNLQALIPMIASFLRAIPAFVAYTAATIQGATANKALQLSMQLTGQTAKVTAGQIRTVGTALSTAFTGTMIGLVVMGIGMIIEKIVSLNAQMAETKNKALGAAQAIRAMSQTEARNAAQQYEGGAKSLEALNKQIEEGKMKGKAWIQVTGQQAKALENAGVIVSNVRGSLQVQPTRIPGAFQKLQGLAGEARYREEGAAFAEREAKTPAVLGVIPPGEGDAKGAQKAKNDAEKLANQQQQLAIDAANRQNALDKARLQGLMALDDLGFQHQINLIDARNEYELAGLNSIQARQEKFQQDLQKLELNRIDIVRKAEQNATKAIAEYRAAQSTAAAAEGGASPGGRGLPSGITQYITGDPSSPYYKADHGGGNYHEHLAFASRALAEAAYQQLTRAGVQVTEFKGRSSVGRHTPGSAHYSGLAFDVPGAQVPVGQERQLTAKVQSILGIGGGGYTQQRRAEKAGGKLEVEQTQMYMEAEKATREAVMATTEALEKRKALIAGNIDAIFPVAQQRLENDLLKIRNDLQLKGMPEEYIKYQEDLAKTNYEMGERIKNNTEETARYEKEVAALQERQQKGIKLTETEKQALQFYTQAIAQNKDELNKLTEQQKQYQIAALESAIATMKNADAMKALQETSERINQSVEGVTGTYKDMFKEIAKGGDSVEALKKAQEALADQALTMFFDFAMQPVEKFFKDQLGAIFGVPNEEQQRQKTISAMEAQLKELQAQKQIQTDIKNNTDRMVGAAPGNQQAQALPGAMSSAIVQGIDVPIDQMPAGMQFEESIGAATENLNTATEGVAETVNKTAEKTKEANIDWQKALGATVQGIGIAAGSIMGIAAGINQTKEGGFANTLGGIGMIMSSVGGLLGGFSNIAGMFGGGGGASAIVQGVDIPASALPPGMAFANGGIARGGFIPFRAFANGGAVSGPTLGLVGEGRYNEAIVPLPDGRSIPVQLGGKSARDLMGGNAPGMPAAPSLNMKFETTKINGVEYVSREQLEMAMAETRRASISGGAKQGMAMTLDKIKQSPSTRSSIGMR